METLVAPWIKTREVVQIEILTLPANIDRNPKRRKTTVVCNLNFSRQDLDALDIEDDA
jgi:hypothetical protein